jgi:hypothetical protein
VHLETSTKPHAHQNFEIFWTNITSTMTCPNFKNGPQNGLHPLGARGALICRHMSNYLWTQGQGAKNEVCL